MVQRLIGLVLAVAVIGTAVVGVARSYRGPTVVSQPVAFNHQVHVNKAGLDCTTLCHAAAATEIFAGLPSKDVCFECHDPYEETPDNPQLARLAAFADLDEDIPWVRVAVTRPDVFFSHRRHVTSGQIDCARCHPGVAQAERPLTEVSLVLRMGDCLDCHEQKDADVDCLACHR